MRLKRLDFDRNEQPKAILVKASDSELAFLRTHGPNGAPVTFEAVKPGVARFTLKDAVALARYLGKLSQVTSPDYDSSSEIYSCLVDAVFNRFWDDGVDGVDA